MLTVGLYDVDSKCQLYNSCCCILSILILLSYLEKNLSCKRLCGCEISDFIILAELGNLYNKFGLEIGDSVLSSDYPVIYNWLNPLGYDLVFFL